jgi:hypothetical protein
MSQLDGQDLFGSGPHTIRPASQARALNRRSFPGIDGEIILDLGARARQLVQTGRLQADTAAGLSALISQIEAVVDGQVHTLLDDLGNTYEAATVAEFEPTTPVQRGRGFWCDYTLRYIHLP